MSKQPAASKIPLWMAVVPIVVLISLLVINVRMYPVDATYGPNQIALLLAAAVAAILGLVMFKINAIASLFIGVILGVIFAIGFQPTVVKKVSGQEDVSYVQHAYAALVNSMAVRTRLVPEDVSRGWKAERQAILLDRAKVATGESELTFEDYDKRKKSIEMDHAVPDLDGKLAAAELTIGKGMEGMLMTIWLIGVAMCFGGVMEACGILRRITQPMVRVAKTDGALIATTAGSCIFVNATASDQYLSIVVPGRMFRETYRERGLEPKVLSCTLEDAGTVTSVLVPWNTCGAAQQGVLDVSVYAFTPRCLFNIINPLMTMLFGFCGINIALLKNPPDEKSAL